MTNKHVIENVSKGFLHFNLSDEFGQPLSEKFYTIIYDNFELNWILHPDPDVDLFILPIAQVFHKLSELGQKVFYIGLEKSIIPSSEQLSQLTAIE